MNRLFLTLLACLLSFSVHAEELYTHQYFPKHASSSELHYLLKAFHPEYSEVNAYTDRLVIKVAENQIAQLRETLSSMDREPVTLTVKVYTTLQPLDDKAKQQLNQANAGSPRYRTLNVQENQWAAITTSMSVPYTIRTRNADGSETVRQESTNHEQSIDFKLRTYRQHCLVYLGETRFNLEETASGYVIRSVIKSSTDKWIWINHQGNKTNDSSKDSSVPSIYTYINITAPQ